MSSLFSLLEPPASCWEVLMKCQGLPFQYKSIAYVMSGSNWRTYTLLKPNKWNSCFKVLICIKKGGGKALPKWRLQWCWPFCLHLHWPNFKPSTLKLTISTISCLKRVEQAKSCLCNISAQQNPKFRCSWSRWHKNHNSPILWSYWNDANKIHFKCLFI